MKSTLSVIIRSAGQRRAEIIRAIESALDQKDLDVTVIVILNGLNVNLELLDMLKARANVIVEYHKDFDLPDATVKGRQMVESTYFCYLDDDDTFLPDRLSEACQILSENADLDVVACNGLIDKKGKRRLIFDRPISLEDDALRKLFDQNWLASCGGVFRSSTVDQGYFSVRLKYFEWTMTAFLLALDKNITYLHEPTFVVNETQGSLSASAEYLEAHPDFLKLLLSYAPPREVKKIIHQRRISSFHHLSTIYLQQRNYWKAWKYHLRSLLSVSGLKYLSHTRHLFR